MTDPPLSTGPDGKVILVVEDESSLRKLIELVLQSRGYRVVSANDGVEALRLFGELGERVSVVLTDLQLPNLNGLELVRAIRAKDRNIPIIIASGTLVAWSLEELKELTVTAFINKPFTTANLLKTIAEVSSSPGTPGQVQ